MIRRAAALSVMGEAIEADMAREMSFDVGNYGMICDRLRRILESLGLQRVARPVNDGSTALVDYFAKPVPKVEAAE